MVLDHETIESTSPQDKGRNSKQEILLARLIIIIILVIRHGRFILVTMIRTISCTVFAIIILLLGGFLLLFSESPSSHAIIQYV